MSVNIYRKGQSPDLLEVANKGYNATWTGTKQAAEEALAKGEIKNGTVVYITDDYNTSDSVVHADSADKALVADRVADNAQNESGAIVLAHKEMIKKQMKFPGVNSFAWFKQVSPYVFEESGLYYVNASVGFNGDGGGTLTNGNVILASVLLQDSKGNNIPDKTVLSTRYIAQGNSCGGTNSKIMYINKGDSLYILGYNYGNKNAKGEFNYEVMKIGE